MPTLQTHTLMLLSASDAPRVAQALVGLGAVRIASHQPFIYTSGWASPVYVDAQVLMSDVALRSEIMDIAARCMRPLIAARGINAIVGTESSGIAFAAWLAERIGSNGKAVALSATVKNALPALALVSSCAAWVLKP